MNLNYWTFLFTTLGVLFLTPQLGLSKEEMPSPLFFLETEILKGENLEGEVIPFKFKYQNSSDIDLWVSKVSTSCSCSSGHFSKDIIPPGATGEVEIFFNSSGFLGKIKKTAAVFYGDKKDLEYSETLTMFVDISRTGKILSRPSAISLEGMLRGTSKNITIFLEQEGDSPETEILKIDSPDFVDVKYEKTSETTWQMKCQIDLPDISKEIKEEIVIHTSHDKFSKVEIPILGFIKDEIQVSPRFLVARYDKNRKKTPEVTLSSIKKEKISIAHYSFSGEYADQFEISQKEQKEDNSIKVLLSLKPGDLEYSGVLKSTLHLTVKSEKRTCEIPVSIIFVIPEE